MMEGRNLVIYYHSKDLIPPIKIIVQTSLLTAIMKHRKVLLITILLLIMVVCSVFSQMKAENLPFTDLASEITPGELLIRLTPQAAADLERLNANAPITTLHAQHNVESLHPLFPYLDASFTKPKPEAYLSVAFCPGYPA